MKLAELRELVNRISLQIRKVEEAKDELLRLNRELTALSSRSIEASRRGNEKEARALLEKSGTIFRRCREILASVKFGERLLSRVLDGERELVEAILTYSFVFGKYPEGIADLDEFDPETLITGLLDFTGELRRIFLESLIEDDLKRANEVMELMRETYSAVSSSDIRMSTVAGMKRRLDILRGQIERGLGDLNLAVRIPRREWDEDH